MVPFIYNTPTKIIFEEGGEKHLIELLKEQNVTKILVLYGGNSSKKSGLIDRITDSIEKEGFQFVELGGVVPNPLLSKVYEGIELGRKENIDFILAIGGGSVIDTAKTIGIGLKTTEDVWNFFEGTSEIHDCLPIGTILTIPAAGSEMSTSAVITKDECLLKRSINYSGVICKFAIMDPLLTLTLPDYQTFCGCVDILMHTIERYFSNVETLELTDSLAEGLLKNTIKYSKVLKKDPTNMTARWNIMWAGSLSHNGLMNCGGIRGDWSTHGMEHEISGLYSVAHGAGLSAIWGSWARFVVDAIPDRFEKFAINVMNVEKQSTQMQTCLLGITKLEEFFQEINMPINLNQLGVNPTEKEFKLLAEKATFFGKRTLGTVKSLNSADIETILRNACK